MVKGSSKLPARLVLIHTIPALVNTFTRLAAEALPDARIFHVLDEPILERVRQRGRMTEDDIAALQAYVNRAQDIGADAVLVTCSTLSPGLDHVQANIPVIKIDAAMIANAVSAGTRIGVIATNPTTLEPTRTMLTAEAERQGKTVEIELVFVEGALDALRRGDGAAHDQLVQQAIRELSPQVEVIVLAQASMARALDSLPERERSTPILTSPQTAMIQVRDALAERASKIV